MNYYKHHLGDYDAATAHLTLIEDGAYSRLLRLYYRTEKPIPADLEQACRLVRAQSRADRAAVESMLREFFELREDGWHQKRCDEELVTYQAKANKNRENGKGGGRPKKTETETVSEPEPKANPPETQMVSKNNLSHKPLAISQEKAIPPSAGVPPLEVDVIFGPGLEFMKAKGMEDRAARMVLGKLRKQHGDSVVCQAIYDAEKLDVSDPVPWLVKACEANKPANGKGKRAPEPDFATLNYREGISADGRF